MLEQSAGLVPIVEPEILIDGDHSAERFQEVRGQRLWSDVGAGFQGLGFRGSGRGGVRPH